ncbi:hypothetical protein CPB86DRAFT_576417 [Serendipita vermifera]|nr:hypothetical protein CPB86DRAFT_576417 [Serendipita vermifera]
MILGQEIARISPEKIVASIVEFMRSLDPTRRELLQQAANYLLPLLRDKKTSHLAIPALNITIETLEGFSKGLLLTSLGDSLLRRYDRFSELEDLDKAILELEQAMSLVPPGRPGFLLGTCYYHRFRRLNQSQDIHHSISKFEDALKSVPHDSMLLMNAGLALFARYEIEECHDDINQSVKNYEEAIEHTPDTDHRKPVLLYNLSDALHRRFQDMEDSTDINQAIKILDRAIELTKDSSQRATFLGQLGKVYCTRFQKRNDPLDIMISISKFEQGLQISRNDNVCRALLLNLFGSALLVQFQQDRSNVSAIDKAFQNIVESIRITDEGEPIRRARLQNLAAVVTEAVCHDLSFRFGKKLDTLISGLENLLQVEPNDQLLLKDAGMSLFARFRVRGATDDLHRSISMLERANQFISGESDAEMLSDRLKICRLWNTVSSTMPTD